MVKMLRMFRMRRYRVFLLVAAVFTLLVVRFARSGNNWDTYGQLDKLSYAKEKDAKDARAVPLDKQGVPGERIGKGREDAHDVRPAKTKAAKVEVPKTLPPTVLSSTKAAPVVVPTLPAVVLPDRKTDHSYWKQTGDDGTVDIHPIAPPGRQEVLAAPSPVSTIHWEKQREHFPIPTESIIQLPTGSPVAIPKIQFKFNDETRDEKINREKRQSRVKEEFKKAWRGYKKHAWLHDELSPVTGTFRDPFCGWAATLVDSLDTIWIMGLEEEFEDAVRGVGQIDFTTSTRGDIPMFETTIRYMGGLLAAYDVSGGKYKTLLDKAVELGEIMLGAFDTPNRMPILYYQWRPAFASQPHRASQRSNLAELGSLSMEFTRLSQLTKDPRYFDAVTRVTKELSEWQDRGTKLDGVFPENVDASGCNRTAPILPQQPIATSQALEITSPALGEEPQGYQPDKVNTVNEPVPYKANTKDKPTIELDIIDDQNGPSKARIAGWDENKKQGKLNKRGLNEAGKTAIEARIPTRTGSASDPLAPIPAMLNAKVARTLDDWDCVPQGLDSAQPWGYDKFGMGGGQDSTYEYFPKQYLLLGGRDPMYKKMYLKTVEAVKKWMLFRPMVPDDRDILFSGAVTTGGNPEKDLTLMAEVEHLTCFIGGMFGMAAKIFSLDGDLELAKKLTDGCVWAYGSTVSGVMPEGGLVLPCESSEHCTWNETAYHLHLDPMAEQRDINLEEYIQNKKKLDAEAEEQRGVDSKKPRDAKTEAELPSDGSLRKRQTGYGGRSKQLAMANAAAGTSGLVGDYGSDESYQRKVASTETELGSSPAGHSLSGSSQTPILQEPVDPMRPLSHKEYVQQRIQSGELPPGFVSVRSKKYILRPEAIESVWYMYRITGDTTWQDKGWTMFESIIKATSTMYGHSAINSVNIAEPSKSDEMESFWLAETLKYFYLLYSTPDTISLDDWVLNTEAHPFKREK